MQRFLQLGVLLQKLLFQVFLLRHELFLSRRELFALALQCLCFLRVFFLIFGNVFLDQFLQLCFLLLELFRHRLFLGFELLFSRRYLLRRLPNIFFSFFRGLRALFFFLCDFLFQRLLFRDKISFFRGEIAECFLVLFLHFVHARLEFLR